MMHVLAKIVERVVISWSLPRRRDIDQYVQTIDLIGINGNGLLRLMVQDLRQHPERANVLLDLIESFARRLGVEFPEVTDDMKRHLAVRRAAVLDWFDGIDLELGFPFNLVSMVGTSDITVTSRLKDGSFKTSGVGAITFLNPDNQSPIEPTIGALVTVVSGGGPMDGQYRIQD